MENQNFQKSLPSLTIADIEVRQFYNLTAKDLFRFLVAGNIFANVLGFGLGIFMGKNLIFLGLYIVVAMIFLIVALIQLRFVDKFIRAHHIMIKRQKQILSRKKTAFISYLHLEPMKYRIVIFASAIIFLMAVVVGITRTKEEGLVKFKEMIQTR